MAKFGETFGKNSAWGVADKSLRRKARKNRMRFMADRKAMEQWASQGYQARGGTVRKDREQEVQEVSDD